MLTLTRHLSRIGIVSRDSAPHLWRRVRALMQLWHSRAHQRASLAQLDDHLLADIGITREVQMVECSKPFWCPWDILS